MVLRRSTNRWSMATKLNPIICSTRTTLLGNFEMVWFPMIPTGTVIWLIQFLSPRFHTSSWCLAGDDPHSVLLYGPGAWHQPRPKLKLVRIEFVENLWLVNVGELDWCFWILRSFHIPSRHPIWICFIDVVVCDHSFCVQNWFAKSLDASELVSPMCFARATRPGSTAVEPLSCRCVLSLKEYFCSRYQNRNRGRVPFLFPSHVF